jgi:hypothetical protein
MYLSFSPSHVTASCGVKLSLKEMIGLYEDWWLGGVLKGLEYMLGLGATWVKEDGRILEAPGPVVHHVVKRQPHTHS